ncbi:MAG: beta-N-acetylhexosaminidase [Deltaproteobacteria bacterium]|nr:beta-N-acetylhexosaminidase [Deltaproteobacteria bacterium]
MEQFDIGSLFMVGFNGTSLTNELRELIDDLRPAGVILFSRNVQAPLQIALLNRDIQVHALKSRPEGIFIGVDQEGGRVRRLNAPFTVFPSALELAFSDHPIEAVQNYGSVTAHELRLVGFNTNFVPVLDIVCDSHSDRQSVIGDRSYGHNPSTVTSLGRIVIEAMRSGGIIPCCKHFPGHGGTTVDSHHDLPVDNRALAAIQAWDLIPFDSAVAMKVDMVMTAHVSFPELDPLAPATLSQRVIGGILRDKMGYDGVVITDDLDMGAVTRNYSTTEAALKSFMAGADLLLVCNSLEKSFSARSRILEAIEQGEIPRGRVRESLKRIRRLKERYAKSLRPCNESDVREYFGPGFPIA